jgi:putative membrane protein
VNRIILSLGTATLMAISIASASAKDKLSETFLKKAIEGNFAEISMGNLAQKNGQSDGVKSYGQMLSTDHAAVCNTHGRRPSKRYRRVQEGVQD